MQGNIRVVFLLTGRFSKLSRQHLSSLQRSVAKKITTPADLTPEILEKLKSELVTPQTKSKTLFELESVKTEKDSCQISLIFELRTLTASQEKQQKEEFKVKTTLLAEETSYFWKEEEHLKFIALFQEHGRKWKKIS